MTDFRDLPINELARCAWTLGNGYGLGAVWGVSVLAETLHEAAQRLDGTGNYGRPTGWRNKSDAELIQPLRDSATKLREHGSSRHADLIEAVIERLSNRDA